MAVLMPIFMLIIYAAQIAIYAIGGNNILDAFFNNKTPTISIGMISQATTYILMICFSLIQLGMMFMSIARASASSKRINDVLDCKLDYVVFLFVVCNESYFHVFHLLFVV